MNENEMNITINLVLILFSLGASFFPLYWRRTTNGDYRAGLRLVLPGLAQACVGCLLFGIKYSLRLAHIIQDTQALAFDRLLITVFLLLPFTIVISLKFWKL